MEQESKQRQNLLTALYQG